MHTHEGGGFTWSVHLSYADRTDHLADERSVAAYEVDRSPDGRLGLLYQAGGRWMLRNGDERPVTFTGSFPATHAATPLLGVGRDGSARAWTSETLDATGSRAWRLTEEEGGTFLARSTLEDDLFPCSAEPEEGEACAIDRRTHETPFVAAELAGIMRVHERGTQTWVCDFDRPCDVCCGWEGELETTRELLVGGDALAPIALAFDRSPRLAAERTREGLELAITEDRREADEVLCTVRHVVIACD